MIVAMRKLEIVQCKLLRRCIQPHDPTKRDYLIPIAVGVATLGFDAGADIFLSGMVNCKQRLSTSAMMTVLLQSIPLIRVTCYRSIL